MIIDQQRQLNFEFKLLSARLGFLNRELEEQRPRRHPNNIEGVIETRSGTIRRPCTRRILEFTTPTSPTNDIEGQIEEADTQTQEFDTVNNDMQISDHAADFAYV